MFFCGKNRMSLGERGEKIAAKYLRKKGYKILDFNFSNKAGRRLGEIDIVTKHSDTIVFVEVKTRALRDEQDILPEENINRAKLRKLEKIANYYLKSKGLMESDYRFDAVSVWLDQKGKRAKVKHMESIFI